MFLVNSLLFPLEQMPIVCFGFGWRGWALSVHSEFSFFVDRKFNQLRFIDESYCGWIKRGQRVILSLRKFSVIDLAVVEIETMRIEKCELASFIHCVMGVTSRRFDPNVCRSNQQRFSGGGDLKCFKKVVITLEVIEASIAPSPLHSHSLWKPQEHKNYLHEMILLNLNITPWINYAISMEKYCRSTNSPSCSLPDWLGILNLNLNRWESRRIEAQCNVRRRKISHSKAHVNFNFSFALS